jgi:hypothetical protein
MLPDGSGFETGPDGWDVLPYHVFQDPTDAATLYPRGWELVTAVVDTIPEGGFALSLDGSRYLQKHDVRFPAIEMEQNTDYVFSIYAKVKSDYFTGGCEPATFGGNLEVTNGDGAAIPSSGMRFKDADLTSCWKRIYFQFNTADIPPSGAHQLNKYGLRLLFDSTKRELTDNFDYQILLDAAQLEKGTEPTSYMPPRDYDLGLDIVPADNHAPVAERAMRHYRCFDEGEVLSFRYWVYARPGVSRPTGVGYRVEDTYAKDASGKPVVWIDQQVLEDPGGGAIGTLVVDEAALEGGTGTYRLVIGAPAERERSDLVFGVLHPRHQAAEVAADLHQFGVQLGNFKYLHRLINEDGDPTNDLPECEDALPGDIECTRRLLYALGPGPDLAFWMIQRLGFPHVRIKHVFHPKGYAPLDTLTGNWDLTQLEWFVDTARNYDLNVLAMTGDGLHEVENPASINVAGYPEWMSPDAAPDPIGWANFVAGHQRAYEELTQTLGDRVYAYEVFNEPTSIRNSITPSRLSDLDRVSREIVQAAGVSSVTLGFGLTGMGPRGVNAAVDFPQGRDALFGEFISLGGLGSMDAAAMHLAVTPEIAAYSDSIYNHGLEMRIAYCGRALKQELERLIDAHDPVHRGFPFWLTETSYLSGSVYPQYSVPKSSDVGSGGRRVDDHREVARLVAQEFVNIMATGWERAYYFNFDATLFVGVNNGVFRSLVDVHGSPRTALNAYYNVSQNLAGASFVERMEGERAKRVYLKFRRGADDIVVVYSLDASFPDIPFEIGEPVIYVNMWGKQVHNPVMSPDPVYIHGYSLDLYAIGTEIERQAQAFESVYELQSRSSHKGSGGTAGHQLADGPTLRFKRIPRTTRYEWDFECPSHLWLPFEPSPEDLTGRTVDYLQRFADGQSRQFVLEGEYSQGYTDTLSGLSTSVHSGDTVFEGTDLLTRFNHLREQILVRDGNAEQYLVISSRDGSQAGIYLIGYTDDQVYTDPRYRLPDFSPDQADFVEKRIALPLHIVDLVEVLNEGGFFITPGEEYLLDLVTYVIDDPTSIVIDDVGYFDGTGAIRSTQSHISR